MGKFNYLRMQYYIPTEYTYFIRYKNKNINKYLLFKLITNLLQEMYYSVKCYKIISFKYKSKYLNNLKFYTIANIFINKIFNNTAYNTFVNKFKSKYVYNIKKKSSIKEDSIYILFIRLLLMLFHRKQIVTYHNVYIKNILYEVRQLRNYMFYDRHKEVLSEINENILNASLQKLILSSLFRIRQYANKVKFFSKRPILNKLSFLIILDTKRFDRFKRDRRDRTFYSYKLQFKQFYKNIYNFRTTKKYNKYIKLISSKLRNNTLNVKFNINQVFNFINDNLFFNNKLLKNKLLNYIHINSNKYNLSDHYHILIGDKIEIMNEYYIYIHNIRKLYFSYIISQLYLSCYHNTFNILFTDENDLYPRKRNTDIQNKLNKYLFLLNKHRKNKNILITNTLNKHSLIHFQNFIHAKKYATNRINSICSKFNQQIYNYRYNNFEFKLFKKYINKLYIRKRKINTIKKFYNNKLKKFFIIIKTYLKKNRYKSKFVNHSRKSNNKKITIFEKTVKNNIYPNATKIFHEIIQKINKLSIKYKKKINKILKTKSKIKKLLFYKYTNKDLLFKLPLNNKSLMNYHQESNFLYNFKTLKPFVNIYKYYYRICMFNGVYTEKFSEYSLDFLYKYVGIHYNYILSLYNSDDNINTDYHVNYSILKQLSIYNHKGILINLMLKLYCFNSIFNFNMLDENNIYDVQSYKHFIYHKHLLLNYSHKYINHTSIIYIKKLKKNNLKSTVPYYLINFLKHRLYINNIYHYICKYLIIYIIKLVQKNIVPALFEHQYNEFNIKLLNNNVSLFNNLNRGVNAYYNKLLKTADNYLKLKSKLDYPLNNAKFRYITERYFQEKDDNGEVIHEEILGLENIGFLLNLPGFENLRGFKKSINTLFTNANRSHFNNKVHYRNYHTLNKLYKNNKQLHNNVYINNNEYSNKKFQNAQQYNDQYQKYNSKNVNRQHKNNNEYPNNRYQNNSYPNNMYSDNNNQNNRYSNNNYPNNRYQNNNYQDNRYQNNNYQDNRYLNNNNQNSRYQDNNYQDNRYQNNNYQDNKYQNNRYQNNRYQNNRYQNNNYQDNRYQNNNYQDNRYLNNNYQNNRYQNNNYQDNRYQNNNYQNNNYQNNRYQNNRYQNNRYPNKFRRGNEQHRFGNTFFMEGKLVNKRQIGRMTKEFRNFFSNKCNIFIGKIKNTTNPKHIKWMRFLKYKKNDVIYNIYFKYHGIVDHFLDLDTSIDLFNTHIKIMSRYSNLKNLNTLLNVKKNALLSKNKFIGSTLFNILNDNIIHYYYYIYLNTRNYKIKRIRHQKFIDKMNKYLESINNLVSNPETQVNNIQNIFLSTPLKKKYRKQKRKCAYTRITKYYNKHMYFKHIYNYILKYNYVKYLKQCLNRILFSLFNSKLIALNTSTIFGDAEEYRNYLYNKSLYFKSISILYNTSMEPKYVYNINSNSLKIIFFSLNENLNITEDLNRYTNFDHKQMISEIRYLFKEKNYMLLMPRYR